MMETDRPNCVFGIETEYFVAASKSPTGGLIAWWYRALAAAVRRLVPSVGSDCDFYIANGGRVYTDVGNHPEYSTPECGNPDDLLRAVAAGDMLMRTGADRLVATESVGEPTLVWRGGMLQMRSRITAATHENYSISCNSVPRWFENFLTSRTILVGSGGIDYIDGEPRFTISPRMHRRYTVTKLGPGNTFAGDADQRIDCRLHVTASDALVSETSTWLRAASTALVLAANDILPIPDAFRKSEVSRIDWRHYDFVANPGPWSAGPVRSAIDAQRRYVEHVVQAAKTGALPEWWCKAVTLWTHILDRLNSNPDSLDLTLDWRIRRRLFLSTPEMADVLRGTKHDTTAICTLCEIDRAYAGVRPVGLCSLLTQGGSLDHSILQKPPNWRDSVLTPPKGTRALLRSRWILAHQPPCTGVCDWHGGEDEVGTEHWPLGNARFPVRSSKLPGVLR